MSRGPNMSMWGQARVAGDPNSEALQEIRKGTLGSREVTGPLSHRCVKVGGWEACDQRRTIRTSRK